MNNYETMLSQARQRFLTYDMALLASRFGVEAANGALCTRFFGQPVRIDTATGQVSVAGQPADMAQALSVYDWLCDRKENACAAEEYCPVSSLPGVYVRGSGLNITAPRLAHAIDGDPETFRDACRSMGGEAIPLGDLGFRLEIFPGLGVCLKFYFSDEDFPAQLTLLWDRNILQFVRYETVYYIAGCLQRRLLAPYEAR